MIHELYHRNEDETLRYDCAEAFVVAAETPAQARRIASEHDGMGDEGRAFWLDAAKSRVQWLTNPKGPGRKSAHVILRAFHAG